MKKKLTDKTKFEYDRIEITLLRNGEQVYGAGRSAITKPMKSTYGKMYDIVEDALDRLDTDARKFHKFDVK